MTSGNPRGKVTGLVFNPWNLLLIVPFIILLTPIYNRQTPEFIGMPFFYWFQFLMILVGVSATIIVYRMTGTVPMDPVPADVPADVPDPVPADVPADVPDPVSADDSADDSADGPGEVPGDDPGDDPDADSLDEGSVR
jgi:hypothetical protein